MPRLLFPEQKIHPSIREKADQFNRSIVEEVKAAVERDDIVVIGMAQNPVCKKARKFLDEKKLTYTYLEYGSYFNEWKRRLALKMWIGWPTFPMVFVRGQFIGGFDDMQELDKSGEFQELLSA